MRARANAPRWGAWLGHGAKRRGRARPLEETGSTVWGGCNDLRRERTSRLAEPGGRPSREAALLPTPGSSARGLRTRGLGLAPMPLPTSLGSQHESAPTPIVHSIHVQPRSDLPAPVREPFLPAHVEELGVAPFGHLERASQLSPVDRSVRSPLHATARTTPGTRESDTGTPSNLVGEAVVLAGVTDLVVVDPLAARPVLHHDAERRRRVRQELEQLVARRARRSRRAFGGLFEKHLTERVPLVRELVVAAVRAPARQKDELPRAGARPTVGRDVAEVGVDSPCGREVSLDLRCSALTQARTSRGRDTRGGVDDIDAGETHGWRGYSNRRGALRLDGPSAAPTEQN